MKVLFVSRATLFRDKGGDTIQLINTAFQLKRLGIEVDIKINNDMIDYGQYDLIHFFNIIRPADILHHIEKTCNTSPVLLFILAIININS